MTELLTQRTFLEQFDKGDAQCNLPEGFSLRFCSTDEKSFDLLDKQEHILQNENEGLVTYTNRTNDKIVVIDYENLIQSFPKAINKGKKAPQCCDFLVYSGNKNSFFICNELSTSKTKTKWPDARYQFSDTVRCLEKCKATNGILSHFAQKLCILSTKIEPISSPDGMVGAFGIPYSLLRKPEQLHWDQVEKMGFSIWEANSITYENGAVTPGVR